MLSHSVVSNSLRHHELQPARLLCPGDSPGKETGVGCHALLQGIFPTQGSNPGLLHCGQILYQLSHQGGPRILEWVPIPSPADLPDPGMEPGSPALQVDSLPAELPGNPINEIPSAREDGGVSGVSSSCGARGGFLPRHDEDLRAMGLSKDFSNTTVQKHQFFGAQLSL